MKKPTYEELQKKVAALEKQNAVSFKVSPKGGVSVYGLGRFPVTLYYEQWEKLLDAVGDLQEFLEANSNKLKRK